MDVGLLRKFYQRFPNEDACSSYIESLRWPEGRHCPHCGSTKTYKFKDGKLFKCGSCNKQFTVKVGTIFTGSHVKLQDWLLAITLLTSSGGGAISSVSLAESLGLTQKSAWFVLKRIRNAVAQSEVMQPTDSAKRAGPYSIQLDFDKAMGTILSARASET